MLTPQELERMPNKLVKLMSNLELKIMNDIVRRIASANEITRSADYQIYKLFQLGEAKKAVKIYLQEALELSDEGIDKLYNDVINSTYVREKSLYKETGKKFIEYKDNKELQQYVSAIKEQTKGIFKNITQTTGFIKSNEGKAGFVSLTDYYKQTLDSAFMDIETGAFDYNSVLKRTVQEMTKSGLRTVDYKSGRNYRIDVASRMALITGMNQVVAKINEENAEKLETENFEVSAHGGARPSHQKWQGRVYTKQELIDICGLGQIDGLCGVNCRHSYSPFIIGISTRTYSDEQLKEWADKENTPKLFEGKEYTTYEATQEQRRLERKLRKIRQDIKLLKEGEANEDEIMMAQAKYRITSDCYASFSKVMGLPEQRQRIWQDGLTGNFAGGKEVEKIIEELKK